MLEVDQYPLPRPNYLFGTLVEGHTHVLTVRNWSWKFIHGITLKYIMTVTGTFFIFMVTLRVNCTVVHEEMGRMRLAMCQNWTAAALRHPLLIPRGMLTLVVLMLENYTCWKEYCTGCRQHRKEIT